MIARAQPHPPTYRGNGKAARDRKTGQPGLALAFNAAGFAHVDDLCALPATEFFHHKDVGKPGFRQLTHQWILWIVASNEKERFQLVAEVD